MPDGSLLMEIGFDLKRVAALFDPQLWWAPEFIYDLQQIPRVVHVKLR